MHPRYYLSPSQKVLWKKSRPEYLAKYIHGKKQFVTKEMKYGTKMATALEFEELTGDPVLDEVMYMMPKYECRDHVTEVDMKIGKDVITLFGKMDSATQDRTSFWEYKTGKRPKEGKKGGWTQKKVDEDPQITFYAVQSYILNKKVPEKVGLVWVVTEDDPDNIGQIRCTGEIEIFHTYRTMSQIINEMADMIKVWKEIGEACEKELL